MLLSAVGGGIILLGGALRSGAGAAATSKTTLQALPGRGSSDTSPASLRVKVMYFQMQQTVNNLAEEHFVLQSPAYFRELLNSVVESHPLLSTMIPTMMKLVDGVPAQPDTPLKDGDEVDLIPAIAGG